MFQKQAHEITVKEAAEQVGLSTASINGYIKNGDVKAQKRGKSWYIDKASFDAFVQSRIQSN